MTTDQVTTDQVTTDEKLLRVTDLSKYFELTSPGLVRRRIGTVKAVDGVSFSVKEGETLGLVGESGSGKSTTARLVLRLIEPTAGSVEFAGQELVGLPAEEMRKVRRQMQIVFQDPYASLNPRMTVRDIVGEGLRIWDEMDGYDRKVGELLEKVGLSAAFASRYPHEFSGGQRQRIGVARSLALNPRLVVLDEPVSALDVSVQAQVLNLLMDLQNDLNLTLIFIAHDLSVVRHISTRVAVMYLGKVMEVADRTPLYESPLHPYSQSLLSAVPVPDPEEERRRQRIILSGDPPSPIEPPTGCRFNTRCPVAQERCVAEEPPLREVRPGHWASCHFPLDPGELLVDRARDMGRQIQAVGGEAG